MENFRVGDRVELINSVGLLLKWRQGMRGVVVIGSDRPDGSSDGVIGVKFENRGTDQIDRLFDYRFKLLSHKTPVDMNKDLTWIKPIGGI